MTMTEDDEQVAGDDRVLHYVVDPTESAEGAQIATDDGTFYFTMARPNNDDPEDPAYIAPEDRVVMCAHRPKTAVLMKIAQLDPERMGMAEVLAVTDQFIKYALDKPSREYLQSQLDDPDSDWDVDMLVPFIHHGKTRWFGGNPTGGATGSSGSPSSRGKRSTATVRSRG